MARVDLPSQTPVEGDNWEVFRDALALPQEIRRPKPWERAPVPAHLPHLQGQKIWKKAVIHAPDKENRTALLELQSEGKGARKRQKVRATENIGDAPWKRTLPAAEELPRDDDSVAVKGSENGAVEKVENGKDDALRFVPRKRTNADHVITPRKPLQQTCLNGQAQTLLGGALETLAEKPVRRKYMRKSIRKSMGVKSERAVFTPRKEKGLSFKAAAESALPAVAVTKLPPLMLGELATQKGSTLAEKLEESAICQMATATVKISLNDREERPADLAREPQLEMLTLGNQIGGKVDYGSKHSTSVQNEVCEAAEESLQTSSTVDVTETPKMGKRTSMPKGTKRNSRTARRSSAKIETSAETTESLTVPYLAHPNFVDADGASGDIIQATYDISPTITGQKTPAPTKQDAVSETEPKAPREEHPQPLGPLSQEVQSVVQQAEPVDSQDSQETIAEVETAPSSLKPDFKAALLTEEPDDLESCTAHPDATELAESPADHEVEVTEQVAEPVSPSGEVSSADVSTVSPNTTTVVISPSQTEDQITAEDTEPCISAPAEDTLTFNAVNQRAEDLPQSPTVDLSTFELVQTISENAPSGYDNEDTDMLRKFLTRVKANKAAKAEHDRPKRKRSLPHSPLRIPLGEVDANTSPSPLKPNDEFDVGLPASPAKRRKRDDPVTKDGVKPKAIRRSGRTRLPVVKAPAGAPSMIPVRRIGQDGDATITLRYNEEKELAALTRVNTRKNKAGALCPAEVLILKAEEKSDPALRQRLLKEVFEDKKGRKEKRKSVAWAEELTQFQTVSGSKADREKEGSLKEQKTVGASAVRVGARSKITLGMAVNGTPAPKRRTRDCP